MSWINDLELQQKFESENLTYKLVAELVKECRVSDNKLRSLFRKHSLILGVAETKVLMSFLRSDSLDSLQTQKNFLREACVYPFFLEKHVLEQFVFHPFCYQYLLQYTALNKKTDSFRKLFNFLDKKEMLNISLGFSEFIRDNIVPILIQTENFECISAMHEFLLKHPRDFFNFLRCAFISNNVKMVKYIHQKLFIETLNVLKMEDKKDLNESLFFGFPGNLIHFLHSDHDIFCDFRPGFFVENLYNRKKPMREESFAKKEVGSYMLQITKPKILVVPEKMYRCVVKELHFDGFLPLKNEILFLCGFFVYIRQKFHKIPEHVIIQNLFLFLTTENLRACNVLSQLSPVSIKTILFQNSL